MDKQTHTELYPEVRELQPVIPENGKMRSWKHVYFHYTKADRAIPILFRGLWSVSFSRLRGVSQPIETSGFSPTQQEEGWEWISVYDSDDRFMYTHWQEVKPIGENVTVVLKKLPFKTKESTAERKRLGEKLVKWRVAPRDIVAVWVSDSIIDKPISEFVKWEISKESLGRLYKQFNQLARRDDRWSQIMTSASERATQRASKKYQGANYQIIGEIAKSMMVKSLIYEWIREKYQLNPEDSAGQLLRKLQDDSGVKIFVVKKEEDITKTFPLTT